MEEIFKQSLLILRGPVSPRTFSEALFPLSYWRPEVKGVRAHKVLITDEYSEKKQLLESFERFAQEKIKESPTGVVEVEGGELQLRAEPTWEGASEFQSVVELMQSLKLPSEFLKIIFNNKLPGKVRVMFITENFRTWDEAREELKEGFINELLVGFPMKTAELFLRMIGAMKLSQEEVFLYPVEFEGECFSSEVISIAAHLKPEVIVTLGAKATHRVLNINDRLTLVHGQFFPRTFEEGYSFQVVPLFHPSIIETNQNMKKTAWSDMQKIMKHLKKLP